MVKVVDQLSQYHGMTDVGLLYGGFSQAKQAPDFGSIYFNEVDQFSYNFENFFHPYVGRLIATLNRTSVAGMLDPQFLGGLVGQYTSADYALKNTTSVSTALQPRNIDVSIGGPYANPDGSEETEVTVVPLASIKDLIASGKISHALVITAFSFFHLYNPPPRKHR